MIGVNDIDAAAISTLEELMEDFRARGVRFALAETKGPVRDLVSRAGWNEKYGPSVQHTSLKQALEQIRGNPVSGDAAD